MYRILRLKKAPLFPKPIRLSLNTNELVDFKFCFYETDSNLQFEFNELVSLNGNVLTKNTDYIIEDHEKPYYYIRLLNMNGSNESFNKKIEFFAIPVEIEQI
jgi:hypothetical protein